jgi:uncharacterized 2Fe-2S/4Fe-4S cluster protein (DUF4445 family)
MNPGKPFKIEFQPMGKRARGDPGSKLLDAARDSGIQLASACGGEGSCGQCQVIVLQGEVSPPTPDEVFILSKFEINQGRRLACCTIIGGDLRVDIPRASLVTGQRLQIQGDLSEIAVDPVVRAYPLEVLPPNLKDLRADFTRLAETLEQAHGLKNIRAPLSVMHTAPEILREHNWQITAFVRGQEIVGLGAPGERPLGYAVDLGTTKIAAYLLDLETGEELAAAGAPNPQIGFGEDVMSRLNHVHRNPDGGRVLAKKVQKILDRMLGELLAEAGGRREQVVEACLVGNTAMTHLLLQLPVHQLATAPYVAATSDPLDVPAAEVGLTMAPGAYLHIPPCIGGFVGADHTAMILACDLDKSEKTVLGIDIGTNSEISLRKPGTPFLTSVSCASGPAFEGAHISEGMRAAAGAIEKVRITADGVAFTTIDDEPAIGLCGSGIIDAAAELYRAGMINSRGRFQRDHSRVQDSSRGPAFTLVPAGQSGTEKDLRISQQDINEIQLAKGAIHAGLKILLEVTDTPLEAVKEVVIAGAFGSFLNVENALALGLFPDLPNAIYRQVGNAAATGAKWLLLSQTARRRAREIKNHTRYNELTTYPNFNRAFALGMLFPESAGPERLTTIRRTLA